MNAVITGIGSYLPDNIVSNADIAKQVDTSDEWIRERTGILQRHIAAEGELTSDLATKAAEEALKYAGVNADSIDTIIVATGTPDYSMPATATAVQRKLGMKGGAAFDIAAACSGFVYGLHMVRAMISAGQSKRALVIGAETMSRITDWSDRGTCILFGDGAGAAVVEASEDDSAGILGSHIFSDGTYNDILATNGGVSINREAGTLYMEGKEVFRHAVDKMASTTSEMIEQIGMNIDDIDYFIPHQANARIIQSIAKKNKISLDKFVITLDKHANTSAASIPLALTQAVKDGRIEKGNIIATPALGAGLTWGCCIIKW